MSTTFSNNPPPPPSFGDIDNILDDEFDENLAGNQAAVIQPTTVVKGEGANQVVIINKHLKGVRLETKIKDKATPGFPKGHVTVTWKADIRLPINPETEEYDPVNGKSTRIHIGNYKTQEVAHRAYLKAKENPAGFQQARKNGTLATFIEQPSNSFLKKRAPQLNEEAKEEASKKMKQEEDKEKQFLNNIIDETNWGLEGDEFQTLTPEQHAKAVASLSGGINLPSLKEDNKLFGDEDLDLKYIDPNDLAGLFSEMCLTCGKPKLN